MDKNHKCLVCGKKDGEKAMVFRMMPWCSERHRKIIEQEVEPNKREKITMASDLFAALANKWGF